MPEKVERICNDSCKYKKKSLKRNRPQSDCSFVSDKVHSYD